MSEHGIEQHFLNFLIMRITHPRFTKLDYSGEGFRNLHIYQEPLPPDPTNDSYNQSLWLWNHSELDSIPGSGHDVI